MPQDIPTPEERAQEIERMIWVLVDMQDWQREVIREKLTAAIVAERRALLAEDADIVRVVSSFIAEHFGWVRHPHTDKAAEKVLTAIRRHRGLEL